MATKDFKSKMKNDPRAVKKVEPTTEVKAPEEQEKKKVGRKPLDPDGRKKKEYTKTINIAIPLETLEKVNIAKLKYGDNLTKYINALIEKDLEVNFEAYQTIYDMLNS